MTTLTQDRLLHGADVVRWLQRARTLVSAAADHLDIIDAATGRQGTVGTNLVMTLSMAADAAVSAFGVTGDRQDTPASSVMMAAARGALLGSYGHVGSVFSQVLRGMADAVSHAQIVDAAALARGFTRAEAEAAAVAGSADDAMVALARAAADAAELSVLSGETSTVEVITLARDAAEAALTQAVAPVVQDDALVDAAGLALLMVLDALVSVVAGQAPPDPHERTRAAARALLGDQPAPNAEVEILAWAPGPGLAAMYQALGWRTWSRADQEGIALALHSAAIEMAPDAHLVVLPNDLQVMRMTHLVRGSVDMPVKVLCSTGHPQGLAAAAAYRSLGLETSPAQETMAALGEAVSTTMWGRVQPEPEDLMLLPELVVDRAHDLVDAVSRNGGVAAHVVFVLGAGCPAPIGRILRAAVRAELPGYEVEFFDGGQPDALVAVGVR